MRERASEQTCGENCRRLPHWIRKRIPAAGRADFVRTMLAELNLTTVCGSAACPNIAECYARGTATFMIMGRTCTRNCRFCAVGGGVPDALDPDEPRRVAEASARMNLSHVVVTSVTRDDLPDGGGAHFRDTVAAIRRRSSAQVEVLTPDFCGDMSSVETVISAGPAVYNHNVETVPRLYASVRPQALYERSLKVIEYVGSKHSDVRTKSGMMLGLGETREEVIEVMRNLRDVGCDMLTIGQYLSPSRDHAPVERFVPPEEFEEYRRVGERMGFPAVAAGPFVRSSYMAGRLAEMAEEFIMESGE